ncbi:hypothetical protein, partial [Echinicola sediminis]
WLFLFLVALSACLDPEKEDQGKDIDDQPDTEIPEGKYHGKIMLPVNSKLKNQGITVLAINDEVEAIETDFIINNQEQYTALFAMNQNDEVVMMGYNYPENPDGNITVRTTALGMLMMSPALLSISDQGKNEFIKQILEDEKFKLFESEIENSILEGNSLFNSTNIPLIDAFNILTESFNQRILAPSPELPVNMFRSGRNFIFNNKGESYSTVIGVYKNQNLVDKILVEGVKIVPNSLVDILMGTGGTYENPNDKTYEMKEDGEYTFKFRTGKPGFSDGSMEHDEAFYENLYLFSINVLSTFSPLDMLPDDCISSIRKTASSMVKEYIDYQYNPEIGAGTVLFTIYKTTVGLIENGYECWKGQTPKNFFSALSKYLGFFDLVSNGLNTTIFAKDWALSEAVIDSCFNAQGNNVLACDKGYELKGVWAMKWYINEYFTKPYYLHSVDIIDFQNGRSDKGIPISTYMTNTDNYSEFDELDAKTHYWIQSFDKQNNKLVLKHSFWYPPAYNLTKSIDREDFYYWVDSDHYMDSLILVKN